MPSSTRRGCWARNVSMSRASSFGRARTVMIRRKAAVSGGSAPKTRPDELVVDGAVDLEMQPEADPEEAVLLGDIGRPRHQGDVAPQGDDRGLDRRIRRRPDHSARPDDQVVKTRDVAGGSGQPTTQLDQRLGVNVEGQAAEDDAQDHRRERYR